MVWRVWKDASGKMGVTTETGLPFVGTVYVGMDVAVEEKVRLECPGV
jgi:hypothetical protein